MNVKKEKGNMGEDLACRHMETQGYQILTRNFRCKMGELDIVAESPDGTLCFVEVKTYKAGTWVHPMTAVGMQIQKIQQAAVLYLSRLKKEPRAIRFDVILVGEDSSIEHLMNVRV